MYLQAKASVLTQPFGLLPFGFLWGSTKQRLWHFFFFSVSSRLWLKSTQCNKTFNNLRNCVLNRCCREICGLPLHCALWLVCLWQWGNIVLAVHSCFLFCFFEVCPEEIEGSFKRSCSGCWATQVKPAGQEDNTDPSPRRQALCLLGVTMETLWPAETKQFLPDALHLGLKLIDGLCFLGFILLDCANYTSTYLTRLAFNTPTPCKE